MNTPNLTEARRLLHVAEETKWTNDQVKAYWDSRDGTNYGDGMRLWLPDYDETHELLLSVIDAHGVRVYEQLYRRIYEWLKPGALFVCFDHVLGDSTLLTEINVAQWHNYLQRHMPQAQVEECIVGTYQEDAPLSLQQHFALLSQAGFEPVDVIYKQGIFGMYVGIKS